MIEFTPSEVAAYYQARVPNLDTRRGREWRCPCPIHQGKDPNFSVNADTGQAHCHSQCGRGWDMISLEQELSGSDFAAAKAQVFRIVGRPEPSWEDRNIQATYDYLSPNGALLYQVVRFVGKDFRQRRPDGKGGWIWGLGDCQRVPFRLPKVVEAQKVSIVEGEKDVITLERFGVVATCNNGGAGNFKPELARWFAGKHICIFPDNDDPGREHALKVAALLAPVAKSIRIVELPGLPAKGDISDFVAAGGTFETIRACVQKAQLWTPEWRFAENVPDEDDRYIHTFKTEVEAAGGPVKFWDLTRLSGLETPFKKLSRALGGGMRDGEVYVIGANQGAGKTSLALQFARAALAVTGVLLFSMEMHAKAVFQRMASMDARVNLNDLREAQMAWKINTNHEAGERASAMLRALEAASMALSPLPLLVSTKAAVTPEYIVSETERLRRRQKIGLVIVDHMQLMASTGKERADYEKFTAISRAMKQVAVEASVPLLLVSQTSRRNTAEHRGELDVSDLRGSGAIEEDAAAVMLLYEDHDDRERALADGTYPLGPVKSIIRLGKNRYGMQGAYLELQHFKSFTRFDLMETKQ
ncbi:MAG: AAA family ATPase [Acidobacteriales bacterium]|nr:AAA family ATPase [Terriglobales bacterium]